MNVLLNLYAYNVYGVQMCAGRDMVQETFLVVLIKSLFLCGKMPPCKPTLLASLSIKPRFQDSNSGPFHDQVFFMSFPMAR